MSSAQTSWIILPTLSSSYTQFSHSFSPHAQTPTLSAAVLPLCHCIFLTFSVLHTCKQTSSFPPAFCHSVSLSPPLPSFGPWPVCLVLGNTTPLCPQSPTNPHALQQHIAGERETHSLPVCLCVGGYMIAFKYMCACVQHLQVCVCVCVPASTCGCACVSKQMLLGLTCVEWLGAECVMPGEIMALSGEQCEMEHT